jgi:hypothetical protein
MTQTPSKPDSDLLRKGWKAAPRLPVLFVPDDIDVLANQKAGEVYFYHAGALPGAVVQLEYDHADHSVTVCFADGRKMDLGVKIQSLVRGSVESATEIMMSRTENRRILSETIVPVVHVNKGQRSEMT